ncbi:hypothetical protein SDJN02_15436, partial [Cucurbita argyrosperma subsp. argyrosperma]
MVAYLLVSIFTQSKTDVIAINVFKRKTGALSQNTVDNDPKVQTSYTGDEIFSYISVHPGKRREKNQVKHRVLILLPLASIALRVIKRLIHLTPSANKALIVLTLV